MTTRRKRSAAAVSSGGAAEGTTKEVGFDIDEDDEVDEDEDDEGDQDTVPTTKKAAKPTTTTSTGSGDGDGPKRKRYTKKKVVNLALDADLVLGPCRKLRNELILARQAAGGEGRDTLKAGNSAQQQEENKEEDEDPAQNKKQEADVAASAAAAAAAGKLPLDIVEVSELSAPQVLEGMETIALHVAQQVMEKKGFSLTVPSRASTNQLYIQQWDRIVLGGKRSTRTFLNVKEARKSAITLRVMQLLHAVLVKKIHITKRDLFYTDVKLFVDQAESDGVLDDVATMIGCTRSNLHVVASDKGLVVGRIQFYEDGDRIDCTRMGVGGKAIPPYIDKIEAITSDAEFILLVEKEAAYMRLAEDRFYHRYPCIIITAKGQPDVATRMFLSRATTELQIPVLGLVDSDPYGLKILSVYMSGSKNMSYDSASLTTPDIKWLGLRPSDLNKYEYVTQIQAKLWWRRMKRSKAEAD